MIDYGKTPYHNASMYFCWLDYFFESFLPKQNQATIYPPWLVDENTFKDIENCIVFGGNRNGR